MDCKTKQMSSYQRLKYEFENLLKRYNIEHSQKYIYSKALWKIANMKGPEVVEAPKTALEALYKTNETD